MSRERDCRASPTAVPWKVPEGAYTSPASLFFTRQPVLATFSRSVASASCQRKQRARFVKPKVKLRSNEGTVLLRGTSGIILPQPPAARMQRILNVNADCGATAKKACVKLCLLSSIVYNGETAWLQRNISMYEGNTTCVITDVMVTILKYGFIVWFKMQGQIKLLLPEILRLQWSKSPPTKQVFRGCWIFQ